MTAIVAIDTETTGVEPGSRLLELAAIALTEDGSAGARFLQMANPGMPIPADAAAVNKITADMLEGKPDAAQVLRDFFAWLPAGAVLVAHNAPFDCGILTWEAQRHDIAIPDVQIIDTLTMARALGETKKNGLQALVEHHGIQRLSDAHRAMSDADACRQYFIMVKDRAGTAPVPWAEAGYQHSYTAELPECLHGLPELIATGKPVVFTYIDGKDETTERTVTPYGWARLPTGVMFHGWCHLREARRTFRADHVQSVAA